MEPYALSTPLASCWPSQPPSPEGGELLASEWTDKLLCLSASLGLSAYNQRGKRALPTLVPASSSPVLPGLLGLPVSWSSGLLSLLVSWCPGVVVSWYPVLLSFLVS